MLLLPFVCVCCTVPTMLLSLMWLCTYFALSIYKVLMYCNGMHGGVRHLLLMNCTNMYVQYNRPHTKQTCLK